jgi:hypothetical protein
MSMRLQIKSKVSVRAAVIAVGTTLLTMGQAEAAPSKAGHGKDYRTFHQDGKIDYGKIGDSYKASLVLYCPSSG